MDIAARYNLPIIIFSIPLIFLFIKELDLRNITLMKYKNLILYIFVFVVCLNGICIYNSLRTIDNNSERKKIVKVLEKDNYNSGYSSFWEANVVTELSNGKIDVWNWGDSVYYEEGFKKLDNINKIHEWLQKKEHKNHHPTGKIFIILTKLEEPNFKWKDSLKEKGNVIYNSDNYVIYGFENYKNMLEIIEST